jgi:hypothetical protein
MTLLDRRPRIAARFALRPGAGEGDEARVLSRVVEARQQPLLVEHNDATALGYFTQYSWVKRAISCFAVARVSAYMISCGACLARGSRGYGTRAWMIRWDSAIMPSGWPSDPVR